MPTLIQRRPITSLKRHPENARLGDVEAIKESIRRNGWHGAIVTQQSTGYILAGNHRTDAAEELQRGQFEALDGQSAEDLEKEKAHWAAELKALPVHVMDVDDETARRILLADNRTADLATYDDTKLLRLTAQVADPESAMLILQDASATPDDITEALRVLAKEKARSGRLSGSGYRPEDVEQLSLAMAPAEVAEWGSAGAGSKRVKDHYEDSQLRQLVFTMMVDEYDRVLEVMTEIMDKQGLITNTDAFFWVLEKALPKRFKAPEPLAEDDVPAAPERTPETADAAS